MPNQISPQQVDEFWLKLALILIDKGMGMLKKAFHLSPSVLTADEITQILRKYFPSQSIVHLDNRYQVIPIEQWRELIRADWTDTKNWVLDYFDCKVPSDLAWTYGLFFADGSCCLNKRGGYGGASWRIVNSNKNYLEKAKIALDWEYKRHGLTFAIKEFPSYQKGQKTNYGERKKTLYCLEACINRKPNISYQGNRGDFIKEWRRLFYCPFSGLKIVPKPIWDKYLEAQEEFLKGVIAGDGTQNQRQQIFISVNRNNHRATSELIQIMEAVGWKYRIEKRTREFRIYIYKGFNPKSLKSLRRSKKQINEIPKPKMNCDNFANYFSANMSMFYEINSVGRVYGKLYKGTDKFLGYHYWNVIITSNKEIWFFEPQSDKLEETNYQGGTLLLGGNKYEPLSFIFG